MVVDLQKNREEEHKLMCFPIPLPLALIPRPSLALATSPPHQHPYRPHHLPALRPHLVGRNGSL
jgi:hypothetical protein